MEKFDKYDLIIQIQIAVILAAVYFIWIPMFPTLVWLNPDLLKTFGIIIGIFPFVVLFFVICLKNYYFPVVIDISDVIPEYDTISN